MAVQKAAVMVATRVGATVILLVVLSAAALVDLTAGQLVGSLGGMTAA